ncbi:unnamed protein product [Amaranthus hypochondriacus]
MEMSNNLIQDLHVAQQRRRDKLRVQQHFDDNNNTSQLLLPPEMLNFNPFSNIHPTRFVAPSSSDSCDPNWVPSFQMDYPNNVSNWANFVTHGNDTSGLSLSLSSNQICGYQEGGDPDPDPDPHLHPRDMKPFEPVGISSVVTKQCTSQVPDMGGGPTSIHSMDQNVGPLGPFTGYTAILKSSKFLKPAQVLLDEFFSAAGLWRGNDGSENAQNVPNIGNCYTGSGSKTHGSNDLSCRSSTCEPYRPDCHERKATLLHMQEEVCKRHKQYHQQMQMVVSAFDSVPGLSDATPYISRSIKTISRHFRCLKNAIADQIKLIKRALGEDISSSASFLKGDSRSSSSLRFDQNFAKFKPGSVGEIAHGGHQNHVWRPQRGLPERAVSILRAWLFDHFLHPYPTDNDKQLLATQTGLTRNQVSNWFINARVRLWKPMVEEIHMLETKGGSRSETHSNNTVMSVIAKNRDHAAAVNQSGCQPAVNIGACDSKQLECLEPSTSLERPIRGETTNTEQFFQKCSRIGNHHVPNEIDNSFIGFLPCQRQGLELGGLGAVSLTLGLRHGSETSQQQLQHQFIPQGMSFGGHVIHDFSG